MVRELTRPRRLATSPHSFWMLARGVMINVGPKDAISESVESSEMDPERLFPFLILIRGELEPGGVGWRMSRDGAGDHRERPYPMQAEVNVYMYVYTLYITLIIHPAATHHYDNHTL